MRSILFFPVALCACAAPSGRPTAPTEPPAPEAVRVAAERHLATVYVNTTCAEAYAAAPKRTGIWVNGRAVLTVAALFNERDGLLPDFAVVDAEGCHDGQYGDVFYEFDVLFVRVQHRHGPGVVLSGRGLSADEDLYGRGGAGSPIFDASGAMVGMRSAGVTDPDFPELVRKAGIVPAGRLKALLDLCGPCEDD